MGNTHKRRHPAHILPSHGFIFKLLQDHSSQSRSRTVSMPTKLQGEKSPKTSLFSNRKIASAPTEHEKTYNDNDILLSTLTGWSIKDLEQLRDEFADYTNKSGVIDQDGFQKLYIAALLNTKWEALEHGAEAAFRNIDVNKTGTLDFNDFMVACLNMTR